MTTNIADSSTRAPFRVGDWEAHPRSCRLVRNGAESKVSPRSMEVLVYLAERAGVAVTHDELLDAFWRGMISTPNAIQKCVVELRHALGHGGGEPTYIETVPKRGYRLVASVARLDAPPGASVDIPAPIANGSAAVTANVSKRATRVSPRGAWWLGALALTAIVGVAAVRIFDVQAISQRPAAALASPKSIAVIRFRNVDGSSDHAYLADGMASALLDALSKAPTLSVMDRGRSFTHSIANETIQAIGAELGVDHVLEGSVQVLGDRMRVSAALYRSSDGERLYVYRDEEPIAQFLHVQDKVVSNVLTALEIHLDDDQAAQMRHWGTTSVDAYLAALEADSFHRRFDQKSLQYAVQRFHAAIAFDPGFVLAYTLLARTLADLDLLTLDTTQRPALRDELVRLREAVQHLEGNSDALAAIDITERKMTMQSLREIEVVLRAGIQDEGSPHRAYTGYLGYADLLKTGHLFREAAQYVDLYERFAQGDLGVFLRRTELTGLTLGNERAIAMEKKSLTMLQNNVGMLTSLVLRLALAGEYGEAERYLARLDENDQSRVWAFSARLFFGVLRGDLPAGSEQLRAALDDPLCNDYLRGVAHFIVGDVPAGIAWWEKSRGNVGTNRLPALYLMVDNESMFPATVLNDSRYQNFLDEVGMGRNWTAYLRAKVAELAPITGIESADPTPQAVVVTR